MTDLTALSQRLDEFECRVVRAMAGEDTLTGWGAAVSEAMGPLKRLGIVAGSYHLTTLGRELAAYLRKQAQQEKS